MVSGLPNGRALYARLDQELAQATERGSSLTVLCFNLTGLRAVNEFFGYQAGDRMLAEVAGRLRHAVGGAGMLCRIAGDEFICLLKDSNRDEATRLGELAQDRVSSFRLEVRPEQYASVGVNVGTAGFPTDGQSIDELLHAASLATRQNNPIASRVISQQQGGAGLYSQRGKTGPLALVR